MSAHFRVLLLLLLLLLLMLLLLLLLLLLLFYPIPGILLGVLLLLHYLAHGENHSRLLHVLSITFHLLVASCATESITSWTCFNLTA